MLKLNKNQISVDFKKYPYPVKLRHHVTSYNYLPIEELKVVPPNYPQVYKKLDWSELFINGKKPDRIDIGCGKGIFLLSAAYQNSENNILGIEIRDIAVDWINNYIHGEQIRNCYALFYSVANGLPFIESNSIEEIYYLFPDPWPKNRHHKRRAFNMNFLNEIYRVLKSGAKLYLATDVDDVNNYQKKLLDEFGKFEIKIIDCESDWDLPVTNKESFCLINQIPTFKLICQKPN